MEASANTENNTQEITKQEIKVDDFFLKEQNNNPTENPQNDNDKVENQKLNEDTDNIKIESEVKIRKLIIYISLNSLYSFFIVSRNFIGLMEPKTLKLLRTVKILY